MVRKCPNQRFVDLGFTITIQGVCHMGVLIPEFEFEYYRLHSIFLSSLFRTSLKAGLKVKRCSESVIEARNPMGH